MASRETPAEQIERLLRVSDAPGAIRAASALIASSPTSFLGRLGRCRALLMMGRVIEAERDLAAALAASPKDDHANLLRATLDNRYGRAEEGIARLRPMALGRGPQSVEAMTTLMDILFQTGKRDELRELVTAGGAWTKDARAAVHIARVQSFDDPLAAAESMRAVLRGSYPLQQRRLAGFEAAGLLDKAGQFRDAFDAAREAHALTGGDFDIEVFMRPIAEQAARVEKGENWIAPTAKRAREAGLAPVKGVAIMVALPRSGTTLLEQMLDRHPQISGIGEYDGLRAIADDLEANPGWPRRPETIPTKLLCDLQALYLEGADRIRRPGASWIFDKILRTWRSLPEIAAVLPGAVCINVHRDPRDMATSIFLSYFSPGTMGWTRSLSWTRRVIEMERRLIPRALELLEIPHQQVIYEDLVEDPAKHAHRCLRLMGLEMDERVLKPEHNPRATVTLSALQVRKPINRSSIGRWKNYEWAFDSSWDKLVADHEAMRD